ncbi:MipA/OmpV family protein [Dyella sp. LX-66]|uniref:MipA/OmpV family protein n=1 Tax=unclassified Dyella TaxID=2634549 RepID=UPI001BDF9D42|nr:MULTISPECIES: MipA/OmpV family protein [unclassified Dyella]MBT2118094.1 MipA/OmpV family protein [Dyella sp. LX-1]MBT2141001.1 MipA/OmpV family protein [Dyella sp. LX-66]
MPTSMLRLAVLSAASICSLACSAAMAQSAAPQGGWTLGLGAVWSPSPYRDYNNKAWPLPLVSYEGKSFYLRGATVGYRLLKTDSDELSIIASPMGNRFVHGDSDDPRLRRLSDRDISGTAGIAWRHTASWGLLQASAQKEFTGHGGGNVFDASYSYPVIQGRFSLIPSVGVTYTSGALNNYYYGIGSAEALRSGLPFYRAGGGSSPYAGVSANYNISSRWIASGGLRYTRLPGAAKNSPMVDGSHTQSYFVSLSYAF